MVAFAQVVSSVEVVAFLVGEQFLLSSFGDASAEEVPRCSSLAFRTTEEVPDGARCVMSSEFFMLNFFPRQNWIIIQ